MKRLRIVVVGSGIGGLAAAIALEQQGHDVAVYDQVRELKAAGAGISLWSNGVKVLHRLGLGEQVEAMAGSMDRMAYRDRDGIELCEFSLQPLVDQVGQRPCPVARTDLQRLLLDAAGEGTVHLGSRCVGVVDDGRQATATFEDGTEATGDLVVAADGTHSKLRAQVVGHPVPRTYVGYVNFNGIVPASTDLCPLDSWVTFVGEGKRVSLMPIGAGRCYVFFDVPIPADQLDAFTAVTDTRGQLKEQFGHWAEPVRLLIDTLEPAATNRIPIHDHEPLDRFVRGRVALLGDSAHTTAPDLGQGGCQAMEDALVLAGTCPGDASLAIALGRYDAERVARTGEVMRRARTRARLTHAYDPAATEAWYRELQDEDGERIMGGIAQSILGGPCR